MSGKQFLSATSSSSLNNFREQAPISSRLNAIDLYLVVCIFLVFGMFTCIILFYKGAINQIKVYFNFSDGTPNLVYTRSSDGVRCDTVYAQEEEEALPYH